MEKMIKDKYLSLSEKLKCKSEAAIAQYLSPCQDIYLMFRWQLSKQESDLALALTELPAR
jgi:hypothetical protein